MRHDLSRARTFGHLEDLLPRCPDGELPMALSHLHDAACQGWLAGQAVEHTIVREIALPTHLALFSSEAFPGPIGRQGTQRLLVPALHGTLMGGGVDPSVELVAP